MMTRFGELTLTIFRKYLPVLLVSLFISACTIYPNGASSYPKYVPLTDCCGIIAGTHDRNPEFVVSNTIGITMLTDQRIIGTWSFQDGVNSVILSRDGTATTTTPSLLTRSGRWIWAAGNVLLIMYTNGQYDILKYEMISNDLAIVSILTESSNTPVVFLGVKLESETKEKINGNST